MIEILKVKNIFPRRQLIPLALVFSVLALAIPSAFGHSSPSDTQDQNTNPGSFNVKTDISVDLQLNTHPQVQENLDFYRSVFDRVYAENQDTYDAMAASGDQGTKDVYYTFQYVLAPTISMYEALGDVSYLERALNWGSTMVDKAVLIDRDGFRNWSGDWDSPYADSPIYYMLWDLQGSTELARMARIVLTDESLTGKYGAQAENIFNFVRNDIVEKHVWARPGYSWFVYKACSELDETFNDKVVLLMRILNDVYQVSEENKHLDLNRQLAQCFQDRLVPYRGGLIWDPGVGEPGNSAMDTSHANRHPFTVTDLYKSGLVFGASDVQGLANLFTQVIWDGSLEEPRFNNFIDGTNHPAFDRPEWGLGYIYAGWVRLGEFDPLVQEVADATLRAIEQGKSNASLNFNGTHFGRLSLAGHLASNLAASNTTTFADVPLDHPFHSEIETLYRAGYTAGCSANPLLYCPDQSLNRAEGAVFFERGLNGAGFLPPQPATAIFEDLALGAWHAKWATGLWNDGLTAGCSADPLLFCPGAVHNRAETSVFALRILHGVDYVPPEPVGLFSDVPISAWYARWVEQAHADHIFSPCSYGAAAKFCPLDVVTRGEMAAVLIRALELEVSGKSDAHRRIDSRTFPSVFKAWGDATNLGDEDPIITMARHDLVWKAPTGFGLEWDCQDRMLCTAFTTTSIATALKTRRQLLELNPNIVVIANLTYREARHDWLPADHTWWKRDENGNRVPGWDGGNHPWYQLDISNSAFRSHIADRGKAIMDSGVFDGVLLDWWNENKDGNARIELVQEIRSRIGDDALIIVNSNSRKPVRSAPYINGVFMETGPRVKTASDWSRIKETLIWAEANLLEPRINCLEVWYESSRAELNRMRAVTTLSLTVSNGYALFSEPNSVSGIDHRHDWYPFWDKTLGRAVGAGIVQQDNSIRRQFENGVVVYNPMGNSRVMVEFNSDHRSLATGLIAKVHHVDPEDGDILLLMQ